MKRERTASIEQLALLVSSSSALELKRHANGHSCTSLSAPVRRALHALSIVYAGDAKRGLRLLRHCLTSALGAYQELFIDLAIGVHVSRAEHADIAALLASVEQDKCAVLSAGFLAAESLVVLERGSRAQAAKLLQRAKKKWIGIAVPAHRMRAAVRIAFVAWWLGDHKAAREMATEALMLAEQMGAVRVSAQAYSILTAIAHYHIGDEALTKEYCNSTLRAVNELGDASYVRHIEVTEAWTAFEFGDIERFKARHIELVRKPFPEQHDEGFTATVMDAMSLAAEDKFSAAQTILREQDPSFSWLTQAERAYHLSIQALCQFGAGKDDEARGLARDAIKASRHSAATALSTSRHDATVARLIAVTICYYLGDLERARRALPKSIDPGRAFIEAFTPLGIAMDAVPSSFRGYAFLFNRAWTKRIRERPVCGLTEKEHEVMIALLNGETRSAIAKALGKSKFTIARQCESIYRKLAVRSRPELMLKAAELGIGPFRR